MGMVGKKVDLFSGTIPIFVTGGKYICEKRQPFSGPQEGQWNFEKRQLF
jgi:hypothetical protein